MSCIALERSILRHAGADVDVSKTAQLRMRRRNRLFRTEMVRKWIQR